MDPPPTVNRNNRTSTAGSLDQQFQSILSRFKSSNNVFPQHQQNIYQPGNSGAENYSISNNVQQPRINFAAMVTQNINSINQTQHIKDGTTQDQMIKPPTIRRAQHSRINMNLHMLRRFQQPTDLPLQQQQVNTRIRPNLTLAIQNCLKTQVNTNVILRKVDTVAKEDLTNGIVKKRNCNSCSKNHRSSIPTISPKQQKLRSQSVNGKRKPKACAQIDSMKNEGPIFDISFSECMSFKSIAESHKASQLGYHKGYVNYQQSLIQNYQNIPQRQLQKLVNNQSCSSPDKEGIEKEESQNENCGLGAFKHDISNGYKIQKVEDSQSHHRARFDSNIKTTMDGEIDFNEPSNLGGNSNRFMKKSNIIKNLYDTGLREINDTDENNVNKNNLHQNLFRSLSGQLDLPANDQIKASNLGKRTHPNQ